MEQNINVYVELRNIPSCLHGQFRLKFAVISHAIQDRIRSSEHGTCLPVKGLYEILGVSLGVLLTALGLDLFLIPNKLPLAGSRIATILHYLIHAPVGITMLVLNVPLFVLGILRLGLPFGFRSLYGTISLSLAIDLLAPVLPVPTQDVLLASLYGGVLVGLGLGLVFRYKGTTGGTDLAAAVLRTYTGANIGRLLS